jgi:hypothetical protein
MVDAPWLFSGVDRPKTAVKTTNSEPTAAAPEPGREELPVLYGPVGASATPLVAPLNLADALAHITAMLEEVERDFPELQADIWTASGDASGRALRTARQKVEGKVKERRTNYDDALVRAQQMAIAIGGFRGYQNFEGFGLDSYARDDLNHNIDPNRPVFPHDPLDAIEEALALWSAAGAAAKAGVPIEVFLRTQGLYDEQIASVTGSDYYQAWLASTLGVV